MARMRVLRSASSVALLGLSALSSTARAQAPAPNATAPATPPPADASLSAGGLAPPPALESNPTPGGTPATPAATEAELAKADREDSGRGLEFVWLNAEVGVMHLGLGTFKNDKIVNPDQVSTTQTGLVAGAGAGVRLVFITLGARFRYAPLPDAKLWTLGAEAGLHAQLGAFEPYGAVNLGYVSIGALAGYSSSTTIRGFDARISGGLDYYLTNMFSLGVNVGADLLVLARNADCVSGLTDATGAPNVYCSDGSSTGGAVTATALAGLHF